MFCVLVSLYNAEVCASAYISFQCGLSVSSALRNVQVICLRPATVNATAIVSLHLVLILVIINAFRTRLWATAFTAERDTGRLSAAQLGGHAAVVWWPRVELGVARDMLGRIQCLAITGAIRTTPTAAMEIYLL